MNISRKFVTGLLGGIAATLFVSGVQAAPITAPTGLNVGDTYRLAFVTTAETDATSNDVNYYNNFVNALGFAATGISGWTAIVSVAADGGGQPSARDNTNTNFTTDIGVAIYLLDGTTKIADNNADLWDGTLDAALSITETGASNGGDQVWTGTAADGTRNSGLGLGGGGDGLSSVGRDNQTGFTWVIAGIVNPQNVENEHPLYAISGLLTVEGEVEVPAPGTILIFSLGLFGLGFARRKRAA
jgi:hypothetical protein